MLVCNHLPVSLVSLRVERLEAARQSLIKHDEAVGNGLALTVRQVRRDDDADGCTRPEDVRVVGKGEMGAGTVPQESPVRGQGVGGYGYGDGVLEYQDVSEKQPYSLLEETKSPLGVDWEGQAEERSREV